MTTFLKLPWTCKPSSNSLNSLYLPWCWSVLTFCWVSDGDSQVAGWGLHHGRWPGSETCILAQRWSLQTPFLVQGTPSGCLHPQLMEGHLPRWLHKTAPLTSVPPQPSLAWPHLLTGVFTTSDGAQLPLGTWQLANQSSESLFYAKQENLLSSWIWTESSKWYQTNTTSVSI